MSLDLKAGTEIPREDDDLLKALIEKVNGFAYMSLTMNTIIQTVQVLRANPEFAKRLLAIDETPC